jgi:Chalcone isomerase-like
MLVRVLIALLVIIMPLKGYAQPTCIQGMIQAKNPASEATLKKLLFKIYDIELWHDTSQWNPNAAYALHITYFQNVNRTEFLDYTLKELKLNPDVTPEMLTEYERKLGYIYPDVVKMDTITAVNVPNEGVLLCHNENKLGWMREKELVLPFFNIWLGRQTSEPTIRNILLKPKE